MARLAAVKDTVFIDTPEGVADLVDRISLQDTLLGDYQPPLYIDIEGERLSRNGKISLLTLLINPMETHQFPHIIDIHTLRGKAFHTAGKRHISLKDILQNPKFIKVFFDVRNDSDALYAHYNIELQGVRDLQLMESACRATTASRRFVSGLSKCTEELLQIAQERTQWKRCKDAGDRLWNPDKGGSYSVFNMRPLPSEIVAYCVGDVTCLPALYNMFRRGTDRWRKLVADESQKRVSASHDPGYLPDGRGRALSPWTPEQNKMLDSWAEVNPPRRDYFEDFEAMDDWEANSWDDYDRDDNDFEDWTRAPWQGPPS